MENNQVFAHMVHDLVHDFRDPHIFWQFLALAGTLLMAFFISRRVLFRVKKGSSDAQPTSSDAQPTSSDAQPTNLDWAPSLHRAIFTLLGWIILSIVRFVLDNWMHTSLLRLAQVPLFGSTLIFLVFYVARRLFSNSPQASGLLQMVERVVMVLAGLSMVMYVLGVEGHIFRSLNSVRFTVGQSELSLYKMLNGTLWVGVTVLLALCFGALLEGRIMRSETLDDNLKVVMSRVVKTLLTLIAVLGGLSFVGIDITVLGVFGGALGVGLGFGLQKMASNYVSGFIILLDRSLRIGDLVTVNSYHGTVSQINMRYTTVTGFDGVEVLVPNEKLISDVVQNYSLGSKIGRAKVSVQVAYGTDVEKAMALMKRATEGIERVLQDPPPSLLLLNFGVYGIDLEMDFWVKNPAEGTKGINSSINLGILRSFRDHQIEIPCVQRGYSS
ncbi:mechanosensitive ion channel family protein [Candidatus Pandoraea novymonadis]|uniref:MscS family protein.1 n=1 Tax=Candidatus Pandoraea novymonadis TaxID=1808959 RepID=A0ABX5FDK5_9BURK|nr:mechanosensitive ion channel domain-containing protein [Candidatus Pandoraea novymonadis]PSB91833.1 putative MscS family protein.1 [Candidatus Pandoraea novymonadis]